MELQRLFPENTSCSPTELVDEFLKTVVVPVVRPLVFLNMVTSVDGKTTVDGNSRALGGDADRELLLELRAAADAVLIGSGTVQADGYGRLVRKDERRERRVGRGMSEDPLAVMISRRFEIPWEAGLFAAPEQRVVIFTCVEQAVVPAVEAPVEVVELPDCAPELVLGYLRSRLGVQRLLCEGGPTLNGALFAADVVDELFLTISPLLRGNDRENVLIKGAGLDETRDVELVWLHEYEGELFLRYRVKR